MNTIPILSLNDPEFRAKLFTAFSDIGFVAIENSYWNRSFEDKDHHIEPTDLAAAYDTAETFFELPQVVKDKGIVEGSHGQRGYTRFGTEKAKDQSTPDLKEFFQIDRSLHFDVKSPWRLYYYTLGQLYRQMDGLARRILTTIDPIYNVGLIGSFDERVSILRAIHYPPTGLNPNGERSAAHEDINLITLLPAASAAGLQVKAKDGTWIDAPTDPNLIIVNVGDMLQEYTQGQFKSTTHRVVNTEEGQTKSRYSMPFFFHPKPEMILSDRYTAGSYLDQRLREIGLK